MIFSPDFHYIFVLFGALTHQYRMHRLSDAKGVSGASIVAVPRRTKERGAGTNQSFEDDRGMNYGGA